MDEAWSGLLPLMATVTASEAQVPVGGGCGGSFRLRHHSHPQKLSSRPSILGRISSLAIRPAAAALCLSSGTWRW